MTQHMALTPFARILPASSKSLGGRIRSVGGPLRVGTSKPLAARARKEGDRSERAEVVHDCPARRRRGLLSSENFVVVSFHIPTCSRPRPPLGSPINYPRSIETTRPISSPPAALPLGVGNVEEADFAEVGRAGRACPWRQAGLSPSPSSFKRPARALCATVSPPPASKGST